MDILQAIILGIVQGLGEFLPISSTAHLVLVPYFTGWQDPGLSFDVALHLGTLVAVVGYFWKDWVEILKASLFKNRTDGTNRMDENGYPKNLLWLLVIASVPGAVAGYFLEDMAATIFRNPLLIAGTLSIVGLVLYLVDRYALHKKEINNITIKDSVIIGLSQAVAIIPGVSRSGATMTAGLALGLSRETAARFSFLLSTPIIFGAAMVKIPDLLKEGINMPIVMGILTAAISGYLAIKYMLRFIQKVGYAPFFWYRLALAAMIVIVYFLQ
jgi:undecaprenyl-diphosphatase